MASKKDPKRSVDSPKRTENNLTDLLDLIDSAIKRERPDGVFTSAEAAEAWGVSHGVAGRMVSRGVKSGAIRFAGMIAVRNVIGVTMRVPGYCKAK